MSKEEFVEDVKKWVQLDTSIHNYTREMKTLREQRDATHEKLITYIETNRMEGTVINISDGSLKYVEQTVTPSFTLKLLKLLLDDYFKDEKKADHCLEFMKESRVCKKEKILKRYYT